MLLVAIRVENPGNSIEKSGSVLGMGSEQPIVVIKLTCLLKSAVGKPKMSSYFDFVQNAKMPQSEVPKLYYLNFQKIKKTPHFVPRFS